MNAKQIEQLKVLQEMNATDETIMDVLGVDLYQLNEIKKNIHDEQALLTMPTVTEIKPKIGSGHRIGKEFFDDVKKKFAEWDGSIASFEHKYNLSHATLFRIRHADTYDDYRRTVDRDNEPYVELRKESESKNNPKYKVKHGRITEDIYSELREKIEQLPSGKTVVAYCKELEISVPTYYRIKKSTNFVDYCNMVQNAEKRVPKRKLMEVNEEPKPVATAQPAQKPQMVYAFHQTESLNQIVDALNVIADRLCIIIDNQEKAKKRHWFWK